MPKLALKENKTKERKIRPLTQKQEKVLNLMVANGGRIGETDTKKDILRQAGYSESIAHEPAKVLESPAIKNKLTEFINRLEEKRDMAINAITPDKIKSTNARDLASIADVFIKNSQLLGGNATERIVISPEERAEVDKAFIIEGEYTQE